MDTTQGIIDALRDHLGDGRVVVIVLPTPAPEAVAKPAEPSKGGNLSVAEVARELRCSKEKVYDLCASGELAHLRIGRRIVITSRQLADYLAEQER